MLKIVWWLSERKKKTFTVSILTIDYHLCPETFCIGTYWTAYTPTPSGNRCGWAAFSQTAPWGWLQKWVDLKKSTCLVVVLRNKPKSSSIVQRDITLIRMTLTEFSTNLIPCLLLCCNGRVAALPAVLRSACNGVNYRPHSVILFYIGSLTCFKLFINTFCCRLLLLSSLFASARSLLLLFVFHPPICLPPFCSSSLFCLDCLI